MRFVVDGDPHNVRNGDMCVRTDKGKLVALVYARTPPTPNVEFAQVIADALNAAFAPSHTDLMASPEAIDAWLAANQLPADEGVEHDRS